MEKNNSWEDWNSWDWNSKYLDSSVFPYIKGIDSSQVKAVFLPPADGKLISTKLLEPFIPIGFYNNGLVDCRALEPETPLSLFIWPLI